ncbi:MAG: hypothetical protein QOH73_2813 [Gaiellaceae bacterium]|nr:hypothetical protein [Gaiellaceae bacterium]
MLQGNPVPIEMRAEARPLSRPNIYLVRMAVFLILAGFVAFILHRQLTTAFFGNPGLNGLILGVLLVGIVLAIRQVARLYREIRWVNHVIIESPAVSADQPRLLAPMAAVIRETGGRVAFSVAGTRALLDSVAARLDENRELVRYLAGLLVFLGLLGTFWGLIDTVNSVGKIIGSLRTGSEAAVLFDELKTNLAAPLSGMGVSFSASLFGLAGSLVLGFLDLQMSQAQNRFHTEVEDWLATTVHDLGGATEVDAMAGGGGSGEMRGAIERLREAISNSGSNKAATNAMANLAEAIQGLVHHMRTEQQMIRDWVDSQAEQHREIRRLLELMTRERVDK